MYSERPAAVPGAVLWRRRASGAHATRILPDACLDLIWDGTRLVVAGPDSRARWHQPATDTRYAALRLAAGLGPALLGVPADALRDASPGLEDVWPAARARELVERVGTDAADAAGAAGALEAWLVREAARCAPDPLGPRLLRAARSGATPGELADGTGLGARALHRRCSALFGYGPRHLVRVLRLERALERARAGLPLARVAAECGYADQAHLSRDARDLAGAAPTRLLS